MRRRKINRYQNYETALVYEPTAFLFVPGTALTVFRDVFMPIDRKGETNVDT
jgi:hypothetical protein